MIKEELVRIKEQLVWMITEELVRVIKEELVWMINEELVWMIKEELVWVIKEELVWMNKEELVWMIKEVRWRVNQEKNTDEPSWGKPQEYISASQNCSTGVHYEIPIFLTKGRCK